MLYLLAKFYCILPSAPNLSILFASYWSCIPHGYQGKKCFEFLHGFILFYSYLTRHSDCLLYYTHLVSKVRKLLCLQRLSSYLVSKTNIHSWPHARQEGRNTFNFKWAAMVSGALFSFFSPNSNMALHLRDFLVLRAKRCVYYLEIDSWSQMEEWKWNRGMSASFFFSGTLIKLTPCSVAQNFKPRAEEEEEACFLLKMAPLLMTQPTT